MLVGIQSRRSIWRSTVIRRCVLAILLMKMLASCLTRFLIDPLQSYSFHRRELAIVEKRRRRRKKGLVDQKQALKRRNIPCASMIGFWTVWNNYRNGKVQCRSADPFAVFISYFLKGVCDCVVFPDVKLWVPAWISTLNCLNCLWCVLLGHHTQHHGWLHLIWQTLLSVTMVVYLFANCMNCITVLNPRPKTPQSNDGTGISWSWRSRPATLPCPG